MAAKTKTKAAKKTKAPMRRARQVRLPGVPGPDYHPEIAKAGAKFSDLRDEKTEISKNTTAAEEELIATCEKHGVDVYRDLEADPPIEIMIRTKKSARLRKIAQEKLDVDAGDVADDKPKKEPRRKLAAVPPVEQLEQLAGEGLGDDGEAAMTPPPMDEPDEPDDQGGGEVH